MSLKHDLFDALARARMISEPMIIVEGKDDYQIYQSIADIVKPNLEVYQADEFENYEAGCKGVIKCLEVLQPKFEERPDNIRKVLGIIDRDARPYRNDLPTHLKGLFVTKYYSIETYFTTSENLRQLLSKITYNTARDIDNTTLDWLQTDFQNELKWLYLCSLEALKNACDTAYQNVLGYDDSPEQKTAIKYRLYYEPILEAKRVELETFAVSKNISIDDIKLIAKGKWYLHWFVKYIEPNITQLKERCKNEEIIQCRSCKVGNYADCLYKTKEGHYTTQRLSNELQTIIDKDECADIIARFQQLS